MASFNPLQDMFYGVYDNALRALEENHVFSQASSTISNMTEFQTHLKPKEINETNEHENLESDQVEVRGDRPIRN